METGDFDLDINATAEGAEENREPRSTESPKRVIGRYVVIERLGEGGMGIVFRAYDPKLEREVALKCLKPGALSEESRARMVREAQAMAKLTHPNVVAVYDIEERPEGVVIAMEYVRGQTLRVWLATKRRSPSAIVARFLEAGRGLQAAHEVGLLHRDFKPANVMVSESGAAKVSDFGLARAEEDGPAERNSLPDTQALLLESSERSGSSRPSPAITRVGQTLGTPGYMAPEQHIGTALTAAVDQYAFAASLWQALTGQLPFSLRAKTMRELLADKLGGPPVWPRSAAQVHRRWTETIRRGLAPAPQDRWPSMAEILEALRFNPTRQRRWRFAIGLGLVVMVGAIGAWIAHRVRTSADCQAEGERIQAVWNTEVATRIASAFEKTGISFALETWGRAAPRVEAFVRNWQALRSQACLWGERDGRWSQETLRRSRFCFNEHLSWLQSLAEQWTNPDPTVILRAAIAAWELPSPRACQDEQELTRLDLSVGNEAAQKLGVSLAEAEGLRSAARYQEAKEKAERVREKSKELGLPRLAAAARRLAGNMHVALGRYTEAKTVLEEAYGDAESAGDDYLAFCTAIDLTHAVGYFLAAFADGQRWFRLADMKGKRLKLGPNHPQVAGSINNLANILADEGKYQEAETEYRRALLVFEKSFGTDHPQVAKIVANLASILADQGKAQEAELGHRRALEIFENALGPDHPDVARTVNNLADVWFTQGKNQEAESGHRRALSIRERALGSGHPDVARSLMGLGLDLLRQARYSEALPVLNRAKDIVENTQVSPELKADVVYALAQVLWSFPSERARAREWARKALELFRLAGSALDDRRNEVGQWLTTHR